MIQTQAEYDHVLREIARHDCADAAVAVTIDADAPSVLVIYTAGLLLARDDTAPQSMWRSVYRHRLIDDACMAPAWVTLPAPAMRADVMLSPPAHVFSIMRDDNACLTSPAPSHVLRQGHVPALSDDMHASLRIQGFDNAPISPPKPADDTADLDVAACMQKQKIKRRKQKQRLVDALTGKQPTEQTTHVLPYAK